MGHVKSRASVFGIRDAALTSLSVFTEIRLCLPIEIAAASEYGGLCQS